MNQRYRSANNGYGNQTKGLKPDWPSGPSAMPCSYASQQRVMTDMDTDTPIKQLRRNYTHRPMTYDIYGDIAIGVNRRATEHQEADDNPKTPVMPIKQHENGTTASSNDQLRRKVEQLGYYLEQQRSKNRQNIDKISKLQHEIVSLKDQLRKTTEENKKLKQTVNKAIQQNIKQDKFRPHSLGRPSKSFDKGAHNPQTHRARCESSHSVSSHFPKKQIRSVLLQRKNTFLNNSITLGYGRGIPPSFCSMDLNNMGPIQYINMRQPNQMILHR